MPRLRIFHGWSARSRIAIGQPTLLTRAWSICGGIRVVFCDKLLWWRHRRPYWSRPIFHGVKNIIHSSSVQLAHPKTGLSTHFALRGPYGRREFSAQGMALAFWLLKKKGQAGNLGGTPRCVRYRSEFEGNISSHTPSLLEVGSIQPWQVAVGVSGGCQYIVQALIFYENNYIYIVFYCTLSVSAYSWTLQSYVIALWVEYSLHITHMDADDWNFLNSHLLTPNSVRAAIPPQDFRCPSQNSQIISRLCHNPILSQIRKNIFTLS